MSSSTFKNLKEKFLERWYKVFRRPEEDAPEVGREKVAVFVVAFILALCLWLMVNLSRDYTLNINIPIELGNIPSNQALTEELPNFATVSVTGEGWQLIQLYNNPTPLFIDVRQSEVNLFDQVRQQMNTRPGISVQKVQPLTISLELEERVSRRLPVMPEVELDFRERFGLLGEASLSPDSVEVTGAASVVDTLTGWRTQPVRISGINSDINRPVELRESGELMSVSPETVIYRAEIAEYTEGEVRVPISTRNLPSGRTVSYSPSALTVRFDIPIGQYSRALDRAPFSAYVPYSQILQDSTGFVSPELEVSEGELNIRLRSHSPSEVAYFIVINN